MRNDINVTCPVNPLGYGVVGANILIGLSNLGCKTAWWPIGNPDVSNWPDSKVFQEASQLRSTYNKSAPSLRVWHQFDLAQHVGKGIHCALPIFELDKFTENEVVHLRSQDIVF